MRRHFLLFALLLAGCSGNGPRSAYERGVAALEKGDARTARIELLNAIKADPDNAAARIMQARAYLLLGDGIAAEAEIERARRLGVAAERSRPLMAEALILQGRSDEALEELEDATGAYAERMRGRAFAALGDEAAAGAALAKAAELAPKDDRAWTDLARFRRKAGDIGGAIAAADRAVAANPRNVAALTLRGELTRGQYGLRAALPWLDRAIEVDPDNVLPRLERAATLGDLGEMRAMLAETRKVLALSPRHPMAYYLQATLAARAGKFRIARSIYERTGGKLDDQPAAMLLSGAIQLETGNPRGAAEQLARLVELQPDNRKARRLLATARWRSGDPAGTAEALRPLADRPDADSYALALMGKALARLGDGAAASIYLTRAAQPQEEGAAAALGDLPDGASLAELRREADADGAAAQPQIRLIRALLALGQSGEALARARRVQAANPGVPDAHLLVGDALGIRGDFAAAAEEYRKAANIAFTEPVALRTIEALERSGQSEAAARVIALFLDQNPRSVAVRLLAAERAVEASDWPLAIAQYEEVRRQTGDSDALMLNNLAWAYAERGDYERALPIARKAWALAPANPATTDTLGWLLFKSGADKARGLALLERAAHGAPRDAQIRKRLSAARRG